MNEKLSFEAKSMMENKVGFRNDDIGTGYYRAVEIAEFDRKEFGDNSASETCKKLYGTPDVKKVIKKHFGHEDVHGLWLTTKKGVIEHYPEQLFTFVSEYDIPKNSIVISDLGEKGILFAFEEDPRTLRKNIEEVETGLSLDFKVTMA